MGIPQYTPEEMAQRKLEKLERIKKAKEDFLKLGLSNEVDGLNEIEEQVQEAIEAVERVKVDLPSSIPELKRQLSGAILKRLPDVEPTATMWFVSQILDVVNSDGKDKVSSIRMMAEATGILKGNQAVNTIAPIQFMVKDKSNKDTE